MKNFYRLYTLLLVITLSLQTVMVSASPLLHAVNGNDAIKMSEHALMEHAVMSNELVNSDTSCEQHHHADSHSSSGDCCGDECNCMPQACHGASVFLLNSIEVVTAGPYSEHYIVASGMVRKPSSSLFRPPIV